MAAACMANLLDKTGLASLKAQALRWVHLGDAPRDIIEHDLGPP
jgi:hypothetical protein